MSLHFDETIKTNEQPILRSPLYSIVSLSFCAKAAGDIANAKITLQIHEIHRGGALVALRVAGVTGVGFIMGFKVNFIF